MTARSKLATKPAVFDSFPTGSTKFLAALAKNNDREWFQPRKEEFLELLHTPLEQFASMVNAMLEKNAPEYAQLKPAKALNRIYRDVRFSADKRPYQDHVSFLFPHQRLGKKSGAAMYFGLSAKEMTIAGGMYFGETRELQAVREHLAEKHATLRKIVGTKPLRETFGELAGEGLQKVPKQFGMDHPAADLLKRKQWMMMSHQPAEIALKEGFAESAVEAFRLLIPFLRFLNEPLEAMAAKTNDPLL